MLTGASACACLRGGVMRVCWCRWFSSPIILGKNSRLAGYPGTGRRADRGSCLGVLALPCSSRLSGWWHEHGMLVIDRQQRWRCFPWYDVRVITETQPGLPILHVDRMRVTLQNQRARRKFAVCKARSLHRGHGGLVGCQPVSARTASS